MITCSIKTLFNILSFHFSIFCDKIDLKKAFLTQKGGPVINKSFILTINAARNLLVGLLAIPQSNSKVSVH